MPDKKMEITFWLLDFLSICLQNALRGVPIAYLLIISEAMNELSFI